MRDVRCFLEQGTEVMLGGICYEILGLEGYGASSAVYLARYRDSLMEGCCHQVLLKELFPLIRASGIHRGEDGKFIIVEEGAEELFSLHERSFMRGNQVQLELLLKNPGLISGNLNSYRAMGTIYSVLSWQGGTVLEAELDAESIRCLSQAVSVLKSILECLEVFHSHGYLYLDISPDNCLLMPFGEEIKALLIDYNSIWKSEEIREYPPEYFSRKRGYSAPEVMLKNLRSVGRHSDLYSVCAVFYRMITGTILGQEQIQDIKALKGAAESSALLEGELPSVRSKVCGILTKGLKLSTARRYQTARELMEDLDELQNRIEGRGVTHEALWDISRRQCMLQTVRKGKKAFPLDNRIESSSKEKLSVEQFWKRVSSENHFTLLEGEGGSGKSTMLMGFWEESTREYHRDRPVVWFLPLYRYQGGRGRASSFVRDSFLEYLKPDEGISLSGEAYQGLLKILEKKDQILLILDGLDEVREGKRELLREIISFGEKRGVRILISGRSLSSEKGNSSWNSYFINPLSIGQIREILSSAGLFMPSDTGMQELFKNPMMLDMYMEVCKKDEKGGLPEIEDGKEELMGKYLECLVKDEGDARWRMEFLMRHFLPSAAFEMKKKGRLFISAVEFYKIAEKSRKLLENRDFVLAFPEYMGKASQILEGIHSQAEWADCIISGFNEKCGLLIGDSDGSFHLVHEVYLDYLSERAKNNLKRYLRRRRKGRAGGYIAVLGIILALGTAGTALYMKLSYPVTVKERTRLKNCAGQLELLCGRLDMMLYEEEKALEMAAGDDNLLAGDEDRYENFEKNIQRAVEKAEMYGTGDSGENKTAEYFLEVFSETGAGFDEADLQRLYQEPGKHFLFMRQTMEQLLDMIEPGSRYTSGSRKEAVEAYQGYLAAYKEVLYWRIAAVESDFPGDYGEEIYEWIALSNSFGSVFISQRTEEDRKQMEIRQSAAEGQLKECTAQMLRSGFIL